MKHFFKYVYWTLVAIRVGFPNEFWQTQIVAYLLGIAIISFALVGWYYAAAALVVLLGYYLVRVCTQRKG